MLRNGVAAGSWHLVCSCTTIFYFLDHWKTSHTSSWSLKFDVYLLVSIRRAVNESVHSHKWLGSGYSWPRFLLFRFLRQPLHRLTWIRQHSSSAPRSTRTAHTVDCTMNVTTHCMSRTSSQTTNMPWTSADTIAAACARAVVNVSLSPFFWILLRVKTTKWKEAQILIRQSIEKERLLGCCRKSPCNLFY